MLNRLIKCGILSLVLFALACKHEIPVPASPSTTDGTDPGTNPGTNPGTFIPCNPDSIYFTQQVLPFLISNCAKSGCHDAVTHEEDINMTSYTSIMNSDDIVRPGNLNNSDLWEVINETDPDKRMPPPPAAPLTQQQKDLIRDWIVQGAQNLMCSGACDTLNVTYSGSVKPLIDTYCKGCHSGSNPSGSVSLTNYAETAAQVPTGKLLGVTSHAPGYKPMPPSGAGLSVCDIGMIRKWIADGAPNN